MKYYKLNNTIYAYELDGSQDHLIGDKVALTPEELELLLNPIPSLEEVKLQKVQEAKQYLLATDFKVLPDYDQDNADVKVKRQEARELIRSIEAQ
jgi:hypothetical protein